VNGNATVRFCTNGDDIRGVSVCSLPDVIGTACCIAVICECFLRMPNVFLLSQVGFVLRATCLNPAEYNLPGCTDLQFFREWDPGFVNIINNEFPTVSLLKLINPLWIVQLWRLVFSL